MIYITLVIVPICLMTVPFYAMDMHEERTRQVYIGQLNQRINEKKFEIERYKDQRYIVEFVTCFIAIGLSQPYAAGVTALGIAGICFLTERIEQATEDRNDWEKSRDITSFIDSLPNVHFCLKNKKHA